MKIYPALTHELLCGELSSLVSRYPFLTLGSIGQSLVGRDLPLVRLGKGEKYLLYVATHHAMEWITSVLLLYLVEDFCRAYESGDALYGADVRSLLETRTLCFVPMLNPDGVELHLNGKDDKNPLTDRLLSMSGGDYSRWQSNGRGVDLNHNYNADFDAYKILEPSLGIFGGGPTRYAGTHPESEPESAALCRFIRQTEPRLLITLHTQGEEIYADAGGYLPPTASALAARFSALSGYTVAKPEKAASYGGLKDWFILEFDRPGFTLECGKGRNPLPYGDAPFIYHRLQQLLLSMPMFI